MEAFPPDTVCHPIESFEGSEILDSNPVLNALSNYIIVLVKNYAIGDDAYVAARQGRLHVTSLCKCVALGNNKYEYTIGTFKDVPGRVKGEVLTYDCLAYAEVLYAVSLGRSCYSIFGDDAYLVYPVENGVITKSENLPPGWVNLYTRSLLKNANISVGAIGSEPEMSRLGVSTRYNGQYPQVVGVVPTIYLGTRGKVIPDADYEYYYNQRLEKKGGWPYHFIFIIDHKVDGHVDRYLILETEETKEAPTIHWSSFYQVTRDVDFSDVIQVDRRGGGKTNIKIKTGFIGTTLNDDI